MGLALIGAGHALDEAGCLHVLEAVQGAGVVPSEPTSASGTAVAPVLDDDDRQGRPMPWPPVPAQQRVLMSAGRAPPATTCPKSNS